MVERANKLAESTSASEYAKTLHCQHLATLFRCLWEASLVKICSCWKYTTRDKYDTIIVGDKPALIVDQVDNPDISRIICRMKYLRNERVVHPGISALPLKHFAIRLSGDDGPFTRLEGARGAVRNPYEISEEECDDLETLIRYTINVAKTLTK